jgi:anti-anti-sigma regulatory factor
MNQVGQAAGLRRSFVIGRVAVGPGVGIVMADMSGTKFCDTSGVHGLVMAYKRAKASHSGFRVMVGPGEVRRVLEDCTWTPCSRSTRAGYRPDRQ